MWRGPVLADAGHHLRRHVCAVALGRQRVAAALTHADLAMELGRPEAAATPLAAVVADEPLHEGLHARLMLALAGDGEQAAALGLFAEVRARLRQELGVEPGPELQAAHLRVLRQEIRPPHRGPAPLAPAVAVPAQLPVDLDGFAGRADELAQLDALAPATAAHPAAVAITVLCGTAGVGKTALAVHWAHRTAHRFPDGQLFVNLHGHAPGPALSSQQALGHLLRALGIQPDRVPLEPQEAVPSRSARCCPVPRAAWLW